MIEQLYRVDTGHVWLWSQYWTLLNICPQHSTPGIKVPYKSQYKSQSAWISDFTSCQYFSVKLFTVLKRICCKFNRLIMNSVWRNHPLEGSFCHIQPQHSHSPKFIPIGIGVLGWIPNSGWNSKLNTDLNWNSNLNCYKYFSRVSWNSILTIILDNQLGNYWTAILFCFMSFELKEKQFKSKTKRNENI